MTRQTLQKASTALVCVLLVLQGFIFGEEARSFVAMIRGAQNMGASDPLPTFVWRSIAAAVLFGALAVVYGLAPARVRYWFIVPAVGSVVYGIWSYRQSASILLSWTGVFHGDVVALEAASAIAFGALGLAGIFDWKIRQQEGRDGAGS